MTFPLFKRWYYNATGLTSSGQKSNQGQSYQLNSNTPKSGSQPRSKNARNYQHPLSLPNDTAWGSDEAIMTVNANGKKDEMGKSSYKSSSGSLDIVREIVGLENPQNTSNVVSKAGLGGDSTKMSDIVITREWGVTEVYEQGSGKRRESQMGSREPQT
jgi:hypothetical protein